MNDKDYIKDLFSEKLGNYEAKVNPELWNSIASQIGAAGTTAASTGISLVAKWIIGVSIATVATVTTVVVLNTTSEEPTHTSEDLSVEENVETPINAEEEATLPTTLSATDSNPTRDNNTTEENSVETNNVSNGVPNNANNEGSTTNNTAATNSEETTSNTASNNEGTESNNTPNETTTKPGEPNIVDPMADQVEFIEEFEPETHEEEKVHYTIDKLPNIITPNGDRVNDVLTIASTGLTGFKIVILNDKNQVVYQSNDPNFRWDGRDLSGQPVEAGNYIYIITANEFEAEKPKRFSPLRVIR